MDTEAVLHKDWQRELLEKLARADLLMVVCSYKSKTHRGNNDWYQRELKQWIDQNPEVAPVLVSDVPNADPRLVPDVIIEKWPNIQVLEISPQPDRDVCFTERDRENILARIGHALAIGRTDDCAEPKSDDPLQMTVYSWEKDRNGRYIRVSEDYARMAGFDSPAAMIGKTDFEMPWASLAHLFRRGDQLLIERKIRPRTGVPEKEIMVDGVADIIVNETPLYDDNHRTIGVQGSFLDVTETDVVYMQRARLESDGTCDLGPCFAGERLSSKEVLALHYLLKLEYPQLVAEQLAITEQELHCRLKAVMRKLQCNTLQQLIVVLIREGIAFCLCGPGLYNTRGTSD